jgi:hypothetical protein
VPILVVWFGIGVGPAILTAFLISFFPIMVNIATGLATLEPELEDVLRVLGAKRWDVLVKVGLPRSMPYFYGSLKVCDHAGVCGYHGVRDDSGQRGHWLPAHQAGSSMQMPLAFAAWWWWACHGHGHVRAVQRDRESTPPAGHIGAIVDQQTLRASDAQRLATRHAEMGRLDSPPKVHYQHARAA